MSLDCSFFFFVSFVDHLIREAGVRARSQMGVGQARNRVKNAMEQTVPFAMLIQSLVIVWYCLHGHHTWRRNRPQARRTLARRQD